MFPKDLPLGVRRFWRTNYLVLILYNFPSAAILFCLYGFSLFATGKRLFRFFLFYMPGLIAQIIWSSNYLIWDMYAFSMPVYVMLSVPLVLGIDACYSSGKAGKVIFFCMAPTFIFPILLYTALPNLYDNSRLLQRYASSYAEVELVSDTWDAFEYVANPAKTRYDEVKKSVEKLFHLLPQGAHYWTDDARDGYAISMYYQRILGERPDLHCHTVFSPFLNEAQAKIEARKIEGALRNGEEVYLVSLAYPHRPILNQLYLRLDHRAKNESVSQLSSEALMSTMPQYAIIKIPLFPEKDIYRYKLVPRT